jgi:preprotein translocase subunit SecD
MKTTILFMLMTKIVLFACNACGKSGDASVSFGIHETVRISELPAYVMDSLKTTALHPETDPQSSIVGYLPKENTQSLDDLLSVEGIRFLKACFPADQEGMYKAVVAIKREPVLNLSDIQKTKSKALSVEIYFTMEGARKWAEMTKENIGRNIAFVIDDQVYSMPVVNGVIKNGIAMIIGLENEAKAKELSDRLNSGL